MSKGLLGITTAVSMVGGLALAADATWGFFSNDSFGDTYFFNEMSQDQPGKNMLLSSAEYAAGCALMGVGYRSGIAFSRR